MNNLLISILLSIAPVSELRGGIPYGIAAGLNPWLVFATCTAANILIMFVIFFFLNNLHKHFMKIKPYRKIFLRVVNRGRKKLEGKIGTTAMFTIKMGWKKGEFENIGSFEDKLLTKCFLCEEKQALTN